MPAIQLLAFPCSWGVFFFCYGVRVSWRDHSLKNREGPERGLRVVHLSYNVTYKPTAIDGADAEGSGCFILSKILYYTWYLSPGMFRVMKPNSASWLSTEASCQLITITKKSSHILTLKVTGSAVHNGRHRGYFARSPPSKAQQYEYI